MPKKNTGSSFAEYMMQREKKKSDLLAELSRAQTPTEKETVSRKIKELSPAPIPQKKDAPPHINPDEYDPQTGGIDTARNNTPASEETQRKSPVSTWRNPDEVDPYTGGIQESGTRNLVDPSVEIVGQINEAIRNDDRTTLQTNLWRYSNLGPGYAAAMDFNDRFQLRLVNGETHVIDKDNETEEEFNNAADALRYIDQNIFATAIIEDTLLNLSPEKKDTILNIAPTLHNEGYEPEFIAGILGNIMAEGSPGKFEYSVYIKNPSDEPGYIKYLNEHYPKYRTDFSGKNISEVGIKKTKELLDDLAEEGYKGKFGIGSVQWTGSRAMELIQCYIDLYGEDHYPTIEESLLAENMMIIKELNGDYKDVYQKWKSQYGNSNGADAAYEAGRIVCTKYEIPKNIKAQAENRAENAKKIYAVMMGHE